MEKDEGVIKFQMAYSQAPPLEAKALSGINAWRKIFNLLGLIGQDPDRYGGFGFGNISCRRPPWNAPAGKRDFVISGTQTGHLGDLTEAHYTMVTEYDLASNRITAAGPVRPSSESLTHGAVYDLSSAIRFVIHAHTRQIWRNSAALAIPQTRESAAYGTPAMAAEIGRLFRDTDLEKRRILSMGGHEDGIVSFGRTPEEAGSVMIESLALALRI